MAKVTLQLRVIPNAARSEFAGPYGDNGYKIKIQAPAVEGKANAALTAFLARKLMVSAKDIRIASGRKGRCKLVEIEGIDASTVRRKLLGPG